MTLLKTVYEKDLYPEIEEASQSVFGRDCLDVAAQKHARGEIDRRTFVRLAAMLGALPFGAKGASAQSAPKEIVVVNWGGDSRPAYAKAFGDPYEKATGIKVAQDGTGGLQMLATTPPKRRLALELAGEQRRANVERRLQIRLQVRQHRQAAGHVKPA